MLIQSLHQLRQHCQMYAISAMIYSVSTSNSLILEALWKLTKFISKARLNQCVAVWSLFIENLFRINLKIIISL